MFVNLLNYGIALCVLAPFAVAAALWAIELLCGAHRRLTNVLEAVFPG